ncbi:hypothetical protein BT67DRAFT_148292 [Trichocladium antarcticum]|uniref:Helicase C-terminal domain-containing protein n=1 Tax=Trichocladium antarcticum TaxID=1450529 RepID=A0AAN6UEV3_9PEZI|nr:hypothetical protein BT67DRAFT_148292 [Trichocladium antarcticum]
MDITQAAFGLDMKAASRIYFLSPVLNPQVAAQAVGRARRISQPRPVAVETLVLRGSVDEVIVRRRGEMTLAEQRRCWRSILDDAGVYRWVVGVGILEVGGGGPGGPGAPGGGVGEMARLGTPLFVFGRGFGRELAHPDQDLVGVGGSLMAVGVQAEVGVEKGRKRRPPGEVTQGGGAVVTKRARVRFADDGGG